MIVLSIILAGFIAALVAVLISVYYTYYLYQVHRRSTLALEVVSWVDDIYDRLMTIHAQREATFTGAKFAMPTDEYKLVVKEARSMLIASKMRSKVQLVYGGGPQLRKFDSIMEELTGVAELLLQADRDSWPETDRKINHKLASVVDPLRQSAEEIFVAGAQQESISRDFLRENLPTIYRSAPERSLLVHRAASPQEPASSQERRPRIGIRGAIVVAVIVSIACLAAFRYGYPIFARRAPLPEPPVQALPEPAASFSLVNFEMGDASDKGLPADGAIIAIEKPEKQFNIAVRNDGGLELKNVSLFLTVSPGAEPVNDRAWRDAWQEVGTKSGRYFYINPKETVKPQETSRFDPPLELGFRKDGDYPVSYKIVCDNASPRSGSFIIRKITPGAHWR